jgi:hypothetical protein
MAALSHYLVNTPQDGTQLIPFDQVTQIIARKINSLSSLLVGFL